MKKRKIRIGRVVIAFIIYIAIGIIPIELSHARVDRAKSELAMELLTKDAHYPEETYAILKKSAYNPSYARNHIHVWDPDGRGRHVYDTYIGGGLNWEKSGFIVTGTGDEAAKVILDDGILSDLLRLLAFLWYVGVPFLFILAFAEDDREIQNNGYYYSH